MLATLRVLVLITVFFFAGTNLAFAQCAFTFSGRPDASLTSEGLMLARVAQGQTGGNELYSGTGIRSISAIDARRRQWDMNGSGGEFDAVDTAIIARYIAGFRGNALIPNGAGAGATRTTGAAIQEYIETGCPVPDQPVDLNWTLFDPATRTVRFGAGKPAQLSAANRFSTFGWSDYRSTGIYARPNEPITIAVSTSNRTTGISFEVLIGVWQQTSGPGSWSYAPTAIAVSPNATTVVSTPNGGPVYVRSTSVKFGALVQFQVVSGGIQMPRFLLGRDNHAQWIAAVNAPDAAPYVEVVSHRAMITFPTDKVKAALATDPTVNIAKMAVLFDSLIASHDTVAGLDGRGFGVPERHPLHYTSHNDPSYYFFAFYSRTAFQQDYANVLFTRTFLTEEPGWGVWHETGHMYQGAWEWAALIEVSVNIYSLEFAKKIGVPNRLTLYDSAVPGVKIWDRALQLRSQVGALEELDVSQQLVMFWQLRLAYGPNFYGKLHEFYRDPSTRPAMPDDAARRQQFIIVASRIAQQDLRVFFDGWGLKPTADTIAALNALSLPAANVGAILALRP